MTKIKYRLMASFLAVILSSQTLLVGDALHESTIVASAEDTYTDNVYVDSHSYDVSCQVKEGWGITKIVEVTIRNTGTTTIENWMVYFNPNGAIQWTTDATQLTSSDGIAYFKNAGYRQDIAPDESVTFSYAVNDCEDLPETFYLCQKRTFIEAGYSVQLIENESWGNHFNGDIILTNDTDEPIECWELEFDTNFTISEITQSWAAIKTDLGDFHYLLKGTYTSVIAPHQSVSLGFIGIKESMPEITSTVLTAVKADEDMLRLLYCYENWEDVNDTDGDGLPDLYETVIGTDPILPDTDGDALPDGYELLTLGSDPLNAYTFDSILNDGEFDCDSDSLTNYQEYLLETDPHNTDTDYDGLNDCEEVNTYHTNPLLPDTDGDGLSDGDEIALNQSAGANLNPLLPDSDGDSIGDADEIFQQNLTFSETDASDAIMEVSAAFEGNGYINSTTAIEPADKNVYVNELVGLVGKPFSFATISDFSGADISFKVNQTLTGVNHLSELSIVWFDEEYQQFRLLDCDYDTVNSVISAHVPHFSIYCVVNRTDFLQNQGKIYFIANDDLTDGDTDKIPDCYESTNEETPENSFILSNGSPSTSIIGNIDSDGDTIIDGDEVVFCTVGDVNHDGTINADDVTLLQGFLAGTDELSVIGKNSADCNLDGEVNDDDVAHLQNYLVDGLYDFDFSQTTLQFIASIMTNPTLGDVDGNGVREVADIVMLQKYTLGVETFTEAAFNRSDLNGDNVVDVYDLGLLKRYILYSNPAPALTGYSYFYCVSDPMKKDSDGDLDLDNADPNPMKYQLNGYFSKQVDTLQNIANEYLSSKSQSPKQKKYYNKKDFWLVCYYIRQFESRYDKGNFVTACSQDKGFVTYVNSNYPEVRDYFLSAKKMYASKDNASKKVDTYHMFCTLSSLLYEYTNDLGFLESLFYPSETEMDNYTGWAGDLQTAINDGYACFSDGVYETYYEALYNVLQDDNYSFGPLDLYADVDAVNIAYLVKSGSGSFEQILNKYYSEDLSSHATDFYKRAPITNKTIRNFVTKNNYFINVNLSESQVDDSVLAFKNFLNLELGVSIDE